MNNSNEKYKSREKREYSAKKSVGFNADGNNHRGFQDINKRTYKETDIKERMQTAEQKTKKEMARQTLTKAATIKAGPVGGAVAEKALDSKRGNEILDKFAEAPSTAAGLRAAMGELNKDRKKIQLIGCLVGLFLPLFLVVIFVVIISNFVGSAKFSIENEETVVSEDYEMDDLDINYFKNYPGLYEHVEEVSNRVSKEYQLEVDKNLVISTLISPIESGVITPVEGDCGEEACYKFNNEFVTWTEFLNNWMQQAEYLAKAQILTYIPEESHEKVNCGSEETMEQYSKNDKEKNEFGFLGWFNPVNWFKGFVDDKKAETNAKCPETPFGKSEVPIVRRTSIELPNYYKKVDVDGTLVLEKDENTGGVYFWNLVNKEGFIHKYLKDYLDTTYIDDVDKNYEINKMKIVDVANEIYLHHQSSRISCGDYRVLESTIENIKLREKDSTVVTEIPFEDQYIGGVMLAEYNLGGIESRKAFAVLARSYAISVVGLDGEEEIENSSNNQNYNPNYSPEKYPLIAQAIEETRGMVLTKYFDSKVVMSEYDAFCPVKRELENGYYYLPDGQRNLPINPDAFMSKTGKNYRIPDKYLECPCFQNNKSQPNDEIIGTKKIKYSSTPGQPNLEPAGKPPQSTTEACWLPTDHTRVKNGVTEYGWQYKATGGHGRGASQYGLYYFEGFGYDWYALIRMFYKDTVVRYLSNSIDLIPCPNAVPYKAKK